MLKKCALGSQKSDTWYLIILENSLLLTFKNAKRKNKCEECINL